MSYGGRTGNLFHLFLYLEEWILPFQIGSLIFSWPTHKPVYPLKNPPESWYLLGETFSKASEMHTLCKWSFPNMCKPLYNPSPYTLILVYISFFKKKVWAFAKFNKYIVFYRARSSLGLDLASEFASIFLPFSLIHYHSIQSNKGGGREHPNNGKLPPPQELPSCYSKSPTSFFSDPQMFLLVS